jgi:hypothetical protein
MLLVNNIRPPHSAPGESPVLSLFLLVWMTPVFVSFDGLVLRVSQPKGGPLVSALTCLHYETNFSGTFTAPVHSFFCSGCIYRLSS